MNTTTLRSALSILFAATAFAAALPAPAMAAKVCPLCGCGSDTEVEVARDMSCTDLDLQRGPGMVNGFAHQGAALPEPVVSIWICPIKNCGGTDGDDPNGSARTGMAMLSKLPQARGFAIGRVLLPHGTR